MPRRDPPRAAPRPLPGVTGRRLAHRLPMRRRPLSRPGRPRVPSPLTGAPWRAGRYLLWRLPLPGMVAGLAAAAVRGDPWVWLRLVLPVLVAYLAVAVATAGGERRAVAGLGRPVVPDPHRPADGASVLAGLRARLREPVTGREILHALLRVVLVPVDVVVLLGWLLCAALTAAPALLGSGPVAAGPVTLRTSGEAWAGCLAGLVLFVVTAWLTTGLAHAHAALAGRLLGPRGSELEGRIADLTRSRLRLVDAFDVERRRIERDLHDGAQQQLVALAMTLDLARLELSGTACGEAGALVSRAHAQAVSTLAELRELIHGIHPPVLTELGLPDALRALADRTPLPVRTVVDLPGRLPAGVETAAYFVAAEALANAAKHSRATAVTVELTTADGELVLTVTDDGVGGADPADGTGLTGLGDRVAAVAGRLTISSPPGGPTALRARIPRDATEGPPRA